jgi:hypothetical protein
MTTQLALWEVFQSLQLQYPTLSGPYGKKHIGAFSKIPSLRTFSMEQIYISDAAFEKFCPVKKKINAPDSLIFYKYYQSSIAMIQKS